MLAILTDVEGLVVVDDVVVFFLTPTLAIFRTIATMTPTTIIMNRNMMNLRRLGPYLSLPIFCAEPEACSKTSYRVYRPQAQTLVCLLSMSRMEGCHIKTGPPLLRGAPIAGLHKQPERSGSQKC